MAGRACVSITLALFAIFRCLALLAPYPSYSVPILAQDTDESVQFTVDTILLDASITLAGNSTKPMPICALPTVIRVSWALQTLSILPTSNTGSPRCPIPILTCSTETTTSSTLPTQGISTGLAQTSSIEPRTSPTDSTHILAGALLADWVAGAALLGRIYEECGVAVCALTGGLRSSLCSWVLSRRG